MTNKEKQVVELIERYGMIDGAHHKQWLLDKILKTILEEKYQTWLDSYNSEPDYDPWDPGIAP
jgi:hypothetical protein